MISLYDLLEACNGQLFGEPRSQLFTGLSFDASQSQPAHLYVAMQQDAGDVQAAMREAVRNGATGLLSVTPPSFNTDELTVVLVRDLRAALAKWTRALAVRANARLVVVAGAGDTRMSAETIHHALAADYRVYYRPLNDSADPLAAALAALSPQDDVVLLEWSLLLAADLQALAGVLSPDVLVLCGAPPDDDSFDGLLQLVHQQTFVVADWTEMPLQTPATVATVGVDVFGADWLALNVVTSLDGTGFDLRHGQQRWLGRWTHLRGHAGLRAILRAVAVADFVGLPVDEALNRLKAVTPLPGRMVTLPGRDGATLVDCTAAATLDDAAAAFDWLAALPDDTRRKIVVLGELAQSGAAYGAAYRALGRQAAATVALLLTDGAQPAQAARAAFDAGLRAEQIVSSHSAADIVAQLNARPAAGGDLILLLGGAAAQLEQVVAALLASPDDAARLARQPSAALSGLSSQTRPSRVEVDLDALAHNVRGLKTLVGPDVTLTAVVKADAYGNGAVAVARTALLNGADFLAVAALGEALELREAGIDAPILVLSYTAPAAVRHAVRHNISVTVFDLGLARAYDQMAAAAGGTLRVHIKVDTGMGRLGVMPGDALGLFRQLIGLRHLNIEGVFTHFAVADEDPDYTHEQARRFMDVVQPLRATDIAPRYIHACNSAGTLAFPEYHFNMVRVGLAMHGLSPSDSVRVPDDFRPVMRWKTFVAQVKTFPAGHSIGYGRTYVCEQDERVAVLPIGYADGFRRGPANTGEVLIRGQRAPLVGRVSMEKTAVLVSHIPDVTIGDEVVIIGEQGDARISADDVAARWGTISYEVLCSALARQPRR